MDGLAKLKEDNPNAMLTPQEYFDAMKDKKNTVTSEDLKKIYENCLELANKYKQFNEYGIKNKHGRRKIKMNYLTLKRLNVKFLF